MRIAIFSGKGEYFFAIVSGRFPEKTRKGGGGVFLVIAMVTNTRDRGVRVMGNEHRYPPGSMGRGGGYCPFSEVVYEL